MASLKELKGRINSVKSTQKITKAKQMVAAAKLRKAQGAAEAARPYARRLAGVVASLASKATAQEAKRASKKKAGARVLRPSEQEEIVIANQRISSLFEEKEAILGISTAQERRRKVEQQIGEISSRRNQRHHRPQ